MKVSCPACDSKYTIADEKVAGRKVKVRCKSCGGQILINGTIPPPPLDPSEAADAADDDATHIYKGGEVKALASRQSSSGSGAPKGAAKSSPKNAPPKVVETAKSSPKNAAPKAIFAKDAPSKTLLPPPDDGIIWSVNVSESDERSLKTHEVVAGYLSGEFAGEVYVWRDGMGDWMSIPDTPELAAAIEAAKRQSARGAATESTAARPKNLPFAGKGGRTAEIPAVEAGPEASTKKQAARAAGAKRPQSAHDLFAAASAAGSELDVPVSESEDMGQKMTGARNENSVLFSLDALKAGITAAPAAQQKDAAAKGASAGRKAPASPRKKLEDLMGASGSTLAGGPAASALTLNASQALLMAPAPPPPPPPKPEPVVAPASDAPGAAAIPVSPKKKLGMVAGIIAAIVGAGVVSGITVAVISGKQQEAPAESAAVPAVSAAAVASIAAAPESPKPAESVAAAETKPADSASSSDAAEAPSKSGAGHSATKSGATSAGSIAGAAKSDAKKDKEKEPKKEKEESAGPTSSGVATFNREAASQALSVAASQTSICKKPDGPTGQGKVQVTFAPSGRATTANVIAGPFGGTAVGGCVSGVFKRAKVPPFAGDPVTVAKSFSIMP